MKAFNNVLTTYIKFCYVHGNFKRANQNCSPSKISQSINGEWRTCDRNDNNSFSESKKNLIKLIMFRSDFSKYEICSESFTKTLYGQVFGKWMHFQIILSLWELEVMTDLLCVYCWKSSNQRWFVKKGALKNFANFTGTTCVEVSL